MTSMTRPLALLSIALPLLLSGCDSGEAPAKGGQAQAGEAPTQAQGKGEVAGEVADSTEGGTTGARTPGAEAEPEAKPEAEAEADPGAEGAEAGTELEGGTTGAQTPGTEADGPSTETDAATADTAEGGAAPTDDPRDPILVPEGTPDANRKAFLALPVAKGDKLPIGGIGPGGVHLDELVVGKGWKQSRCETESSEFTAGIDDKVNLCVRVVHERGTEEELTVKWIKEGKGPKRSKLTVKPIHAYLTRVWLPVKGWSKGNWTVVVEASDGTELGKGTFTVD